MPLCPQASDFIRFYMQIWTNQCPELERGNAYMNATLELNGTENAVPPRDTSAGRASTSECLCLWQLLETMQADPPPSFPMLKSTAARIAEFYGRSPDAVTMTMIRADKQEFIDYLR